MARHCRSFHIKATQHSIVEGMRQHFSRPFSLPRNQTQIQQKGSNPSWEKLSISLYNRDTRVTRKLKTVDDHIAVLTSNDGSSDGGMSDVGGLVNETSLRLDNSNDGNMDGAVVRTEIEVVLYSGNDIEDCTMSSPTVEGFFKMTNERSELNVASIAHTAGSVLLSEMVFLDEKQLKKEKRKHANRESATRSRLRKQAELDELITKYESGSKENVALKSEINQLVEVSEKMRLENAALMEKLRNAKLSGRRGKVSAEDAKLKQERRKQSNRESARRSHLRKQAEMAAAAMAFESASAENLALKSEINQLTEASERVRLENAAIKEKLKLNHLTCLTNSENKPHMLLASKTHIVASR